ncbi:hypothetical protein OIY81_2596 [Cryptosporidium canis]|uniref:Transmembrane protein n=1 Tax=Cryptosporidium canis TaxID=195482 RepID=A0ABQ8PBP8_9CRYT|nr:hypothetical protein OIY81_2596 [Cryptosporidium canis]KAJ1615397.1 hypothetical protein OJ252_167 [Cryptosporidium canis]
MTTPRGLHSLLFFPILVLCTIGDFVYQGSHSLFIRSLELSGDVSSGGIPFGVDLEADNQMMEEILAGIEQEKSLNGGSRERVTLSSRLQAGQSGSGAGQLGSGDEDSFVKFDTRQMRHFNIEDITFNSTIRNFDTEKARYHRVIKSGIKFAEYSLELSRKQKKTTLLYSGVKKIKALHLNQERSTASASIIASVTILKSLLYKELPTNTKWVYYTFYPLILSSYLQSYNSFKTGSQPKGFISKAIYSKKNQALFRLNKSLLRLSRHINSLEADGRYNYSVKPWSFWRLVEPTIVSPAHGLITTDLIKKPRSLSGEYLKDVMSILKSSKYRLAVAQNKAREDFYYYINHDLETAKD